MRVLEAGSSIELCGGTHVRATGDIGTIKVVSESSIGSNLRRIEAVTGAASVALLQRDEQLLADAARLVGAPTDDLLAGVQRKLDEVKALQRRDQGRCAASWRSGRASELAAIAHDGVVVTQVDGLAPGDLRELADRRAPAAGHPSRRAHRRDDERGSRARRRGRSRAADVRRAT